MTWTRERWARIEAVFHQVAEAGAAQQRERLDAVCAEDHDLRRDVLRLLQADGLAEPALIDGGIGTALRGHDPLLGQCFGAFELVERLAEGGMGTVYRGERRDGDFEQEAAVKILRLGLSTPSMRERFARERRTLATLVHPHVARLFDGGTTESGVPFIAMELVDGVPIDRFCDQRGATVAQRLQLFATVCRAVHFAHQNLVVHLDLKPSNILVDDVGGPKLVDFGVAALLQGEGDGAVAVTRSRPLTPEYASPELLRGDPVSTAADVWSLGAVLFELLTGARAFRPTRSDLELARLVCETEVPRPSETFADATAARERARQRSGTPAELERTVRGDLDRIVQKAMRREAAARYASCSDLADDVERYLAGFPIRAREPSLGYRARKFVARNRLAVTAAAAVLVALVAGLLATLHMARVASDERDAAAAAWREAEAARELATAAGERAARDAAHARIEAMSSRLVAEFLGDTFLSGIFVTDPEQRAAALATIRRRAGQVRRQHGDDPHLQANLLHSLGQAAQRVGATDEAERLLGEAAAMRHEQFGVDSLENALSLGALGQLFYAEGRLEEAAAALRTAYRLQRDCPRDVHTDVALAANDLAAVERALGNVARARELHAEALALRRAGGQPARIAESLNNLANSEPDLRQARALLDEALALRRAAFGDDDPLTLQSMTNLAAVSLRLGEPDAARALLREATGRARQLGALGAEGLAVALRLLAMTELAADDLAAAEAAIAESLALDRARLGDGHAKLATPLEMQAKILERQDRWREAVATWRQVLDLRRTMLPSGHRLLPLTRCNLGTALVRAGEVPAGVAEVRAAYALLGAAAPVDRVDAAVHLALAEEAAGDVAAAERILRDALATCATAAAAPRTAAVQAHLDDLLRRHGR